MLVRANGNHSDALALNQLGIPTLIDPFLSIVASPNQAPAYELLHATSSVTTPTWIIATSSNAISSWTQIVGAEALSKAFTNPFLSFAAVGDSTKTQLANLGATNIKVGPSKNSQSLLESFRATPATTALIPSGNLSMELIPTNLAAVGWKIVRAVVYETTIIQEIPSSIARIQSGDFSTILLRSPSAARALIHFLPHPEIPVICGGPTTAKECERLRLAIAAVAPEPTAEQIAILVRNWLKVE